MNFFSGNYRRFDHTQNVNPNQDPILERSGNSSDRLIMTSSNSAETFASVGSEDESVTSLDNGEETMTSAGNETVTSSGNGTVTSSPHSVIVTSPEEDIVTSSNSVLNITDEKKGDLLTVNNSLEVRGSMDYEGNCLQEELFLHATSFYEYNPEDDELDDELGFRDPANPPTRGWNLKYLQWRTRRFVEHVSLRLLTAFFIVADMVILLVDLFNNPTEANDPLEYCSLAFSLYFALEVVLRMFGLGWWAYFRKWYNALDFVIVVTTLALSVLMVVLEDMASNPANLLIILRLIRLVRITRILWERRHLEVGARMFISQNKRRYQRDGFDLDLTYVAPRIIAMSFPSSGKMSMYRNDIKEVARFLNTKHKNHYRVFNLCSERHYDVKKFNGRVQRFFIDDHNVPTLQDMLQFSKNVREFMAADEENVIAVHCKGGKGRTGTMVCVVLIDTGLFADASDCLGFFGDRRTDKNAGKKFQGVETPSQCRYVEYYEQVVKSNRKLPPEKSFLIIAFTINGINSVGNGSGSDLSLTVRSRCYVTAYEASLQSRHNCRGYHDKERDELYIELTNPPKIRGDTKVMFHSRNKKIPRGYERCPFYFWFNTGFIEGNQLELTRQELDNPHKHKTWNVFTEKFKVTVHFRINKDYHSIP